ncbi:MAG: hypothetical protein CVV42_13255 [Candidatus Riflebacteria bacterium HGW-Riflebacteria-2]|jgi:hypothetical protein|nr:MAG: hypothetical protein CVV42_13255 [Candidatus Riflebacteria bacterium HGW-Riflebacteria-2]
MSRQHAGSGQAILAIVMICLVLGILAGMVLTFQRGQIALLSRSARDYVALSVAEAGLHAVLAEMRADYQFVTHGNPYIPKEGWPSASENRYNHLKSFGLLKLDNNSRGTYSGAVELPAMKLTGHFKVRVKLIDSDNSPDSKTVDESHRYFLLEAVGKVEDTCRKISTVIEKIVPGNFLFYDGQILDVGGYGPYRVSPGEMKTGRLYGHEMLIFSQRGTFDRGAELREMERISTPGFIRAESSVHVDFYNGKGGTIKSSNDSTDPDNFESFADYKNGKLIDAFVLDGYHGARPQKLPPLNPEYYKKARRPEPKILRAGSSFKGFSESKWRCPANPSETVYDLFFGWEYKNTDDKVLIYSEVPLRIWGCPPWKSLTIFCEKDVFIAGDFNANPDNPQNYGAGFKDYSKEPRNGTDKNGVAVLSMGRIWFDYSNPMNFLRNEMRTLIDYDLAMALGGEDLNLLILGGIVFPPRLSTGAYDKRLPMTALNFSVINSLFSMPKQPPEIIPVTTAGIALHPALGKLRDYLKPGSTPEENQNRFVIKSAMRRTAVYEGVGARSYMTGTLLAGARDKIIDSIMDQAAKEMQEGEPDPSLGPWNIADRLFQMALKYPRTGFRMPEMTVNALLIDSAELNARWSMGNNTTKVRNELGNVANPHMQSLPFIGRDSRFILRHMGSMIHLRTRPAKAYLDGSLRNDQSVVRRNIFDTTFVPGGGDYHPPYPMAGFTIISWKDESITAEDYDKID